VGSVMCLRDSLKQATEHQDAATKQITKHNHDIYIYIYTYLLLLSMSVVVIVICHDCYKRMVYTYTQYITISTSD
jgi:hypothetical protein